VKVYQIVLSLSTQIIVQELVLHFLLLFILITLMVSNYHVKMFVDKRILFKFEVSDANLYRNWRSYTVKRMTMNEEIINRFLDLHEINVKSNYDYFFLIICQPIICKLRHDPFDFFFFSAW